MRALGQDRKAKIIIAHMLPLIVVKGIDLLSYPNPTETNVTYLAQVITKTFIYKPKSTISRKWLKVDLYCRSSS